MTTHVTVAGNAGGDPELRFAPNGDPVCNFNVAVNQRKRSGDEYVDDGTAWYRIVCWRELARNVSDTIAKGTRVHVSGLLKAREWETDSGEKRTTWEIVADECSPSLRWATAQVTRNERRSGPPLPDEPPQHHDPSEQPFAPF